MRKYIWYLACSFAVIIFFGSIWPCYLSTVEKSDPSILTLERIFSSKKFTPERFGPAKWMKKREAFTILESSSEKVNNLDIVLYDPETNLRQTLVPSIRLIPTGKSKPLKVYDYFLSTDGKKLLIFSNTKRVWRRNTRGDYWVLDLVTWNLHKLGGEADPSSLMFAKFSPDGDRVGYVFRNDIYVENLSHHKRWFSVCYQRDF